MKRMTAEDGEYLYEAYEKVLEEIELLREIIKDQKAEIEELTQSLNEERGFGGYHYDE